MPLASHAERRLAAWAIVLTLMALILRLVAARDELWLDEITTINLVRHLHSATDVFFRVHRDNNHHLNSLYLHLIGTRHGPVALRFLSVVAGSLGVPAIGMVMARRGGGRLAAVIAMAWMAMNYFAVHYGSEARGYALAGLFATLIILRIEAGLDGRRAPLQLAILLFLGIISHLFMVLFALGTALWVACRQWQTGVRADRAIGYAVKAFLPGALLASLLVIDVVQGYRERIFRPELILDPLDTRLDSFGQFFATSLGLPYTTSGVAGFAACGGLLVLALACRRHVDHSRLPLYLIMLGLYPAVLLAARMHEPGPRYLMPALPALLMLVAELAVLGLRSRLAVRLTTAVVLTACLVGNTLSLCHFFDQGRGHYAEAVADMTSAGPARYGLRVPFGVGTVVTFYAERMGRDVRQATYEDWCMDPPQWFIRGSDPEHPFPPGLVEGPSPCRTRFTMVRVYRYWGLSGWEWTLYGREPLSGRVAAKPPVGTSSGTR